MPILDLLDPKLHVTEEIRSARLELCNACPYKRIKFRLEVCYFCGCLINEKTKLKTEGCPILKWNKVLT